MNEKTINLTPNYKKQYAVVFGCALAVYVATCAPGLVFQDSAMIQYRTWNNDIVGALGLALAHPLYYIITIATKYIPLGNFAFKINLVSSVVSAFAVANLFLLIRIWLKRTSPAVIAAVSFALSHTFWRHATIPETYNLYIALFLTELLLLWNYLNTNRTKSLYLLFFVNGLSLSTHMLGVIPLSCYTILLAVHLFKGKIRLKHISIIIIIWLAGAFPYLYLITDELIRTHDFAGTISSALFGLSWKSDVLNTKISARIMMQNVLFLGLNFPTPNLLLAGAGLICIKKYTPSKTFRNIILTLTVLFLLFASRYTVADRYAFFIPFYCIVSIFIAIGAERIISKANRKNLAFTIIIIQAVSVVIIYAMAPAAARKANFSLGTRGDIKYRDDYKWFLQPWRSGYHGAEKYAREVLTSVEDGAVIIADGTTVYPILLTQQIEKIRPDVVVITSHGSAKNSNVYCQKYIADKIAAGLVYSTRQHCPLLRPYLDSYCMKKTDILWKILPLENTSISN